MLSSQQIDKLVKKIYPASTFSRKERTYFRRAMREDITEYLEEHPDATYEDVQQHFADQEIPEDMQESFPLRKTMSIVCIALLLVIICAILINLSNTWEPPTYYIHL